MFPKVDAFFKHSSEAEFTTKNVYIIKWEKSTAGTKLLLVNLRRPKVPFQRLAKTFTIRIQLSSQASVTFLLHYHIES